MPEQGADPGRIFKLTFHVEGMDFGAAGDAASNIKRALQQIGLDPAVVRRAAVTTYEAETNIVIHAFRGQISIEVTTSGVEIVASDDGPGIADIDLAMREGFSTAPAHIREMGFGAGMGLPNIKRCSDELSIISEVGKGTTLRAFIRFGRSRGSEKQ